MFNNQIIAGAAGQGGGFYPYSIDQSLRFNDNDSAYLNRTPASAGNQRTWTWSCWLKRGNITLGSSNHQTLFSCGTENTQIRFHATDDTLDILFGGSTDGHLRTSQVFRDTSAFYNIVVQVDTTQSTSTDRCKVYINGTQVTSFGTSTYPAQNYDTGINNTEAHNVGRSAFDSNRYFDGYMAEVNFIDGTALDPTSFGETINGIWVPKAYSGSYGTNGFYLSFADSSAIGDDLSGNTNDFTATNLVASDVMSGESPTNNFATLNSLHPNASTGNFSEGNLRSYQDQSPYTDFYATFAVSSGKWYWEARAASTASQQIWGFAREDALTTANGGAAAGSIGYAYLRYGTVARERANGSNVNASGTLSVAAGDIIALALNLDDNEIKFYKNGTLEHTITGVQDGTYYPFVCYQMNLNRLEQRVNFGQDSTFAGLETAGGNSDDNGIGDFAQSPISGHLAICSANLPEPTISPNADEQADDYFNTVLYTGDGTSSNAITGVGFQPDFVWIKSRSLAVDHVLQDVVRGLGSGGVAFNTLQSSGTDAEINQTDNDGLLSLDSDGFTVGYNNSNAWNASSATYASWNWKAGGAAVSNTDGSITSQVSAAPDAGFSIVTYASTTGTVGHGLTQAPEAIIMKGRNVSDQWTVGHKDLNSGNSPWNYGIPLNTNALTQTNSGFWNNTAPTSTVFSQGSWDSGYNKVAYCFHSVDGYCKVGSYVGNGSSDGPFIFTGFRPAWVMHKTIDTTANHWSIRDNKRDPDNEVLLALYANLTNADDLGGDAIAIDFLSNGFKPRRTNSQLNQSGTNYIYLAFAENPFKYANAR